MTNITLNPHRLVWKILIDEQWIHCFVSEGIRLNTIKLCIIFNVHTVT